MYHCTHCHKQSDDKTGWYFDGIGGSYCQNCIFLAIELLDQDPPNAKEPVPTPPLCEGCGMWVGHAPGCPEIAHLPPGVNVR